MSTSGASTPRGFTSQGASAEDALKTQTVGLVQLDEFRKRRRDVHEAYGKDSDGALTPQSEGSDGPSNFKKKRKTAKKIALSFGNDDEEDDSAGPTTQLKPKSRQKESKGGENEDDTAETSAQPTRKLKPNPNSGLPAPKAMTKAALAAEAAETERMRKTILEQQELLRRSDFMIPFVFYDGANSPGDKIKMRKGDPIWLFLEKCRKVGAELGVSSSGSVEGGGTRQRVEGKKSWARIGVDDLMLVRGDIIVPHHYEFYYFIIESIEDPGTPGRLLFNYSKTPTAKPEGEEQALLRQPKDETYEGQDDDPAYTKVVDRRWYEKNKHIYPASQWREYRPGKDFEDLAKGRRDNEGNAFFYS